MWAWSNWCLPSLQGTSSTTTPQVAAVDAPHAVQKENQKAPERDELKAPLGKMIVTRRRLVAPRADRRRALPWPDGYFDGFLVGAEAGWW